MKTYRISGAYTVDFTVEVEATDRESAIEEVEMGGFPAIESGADGFERVEVDSCDELTKAPKKKRAKKATTR